MKERRELETEEFMLQQRKRAFDVRIEIAKAEAMEKAYSEFDIE
jgi:hypothetical protein